MKINLQLSILFLLLVFLSCTKDDKITGSGNLISQNRDVASFTQVDNSTSIDILITEGATQEVEVSADDNVVNEVKTIVENGVLKVDLSRANYIDVTITMSVTIPNLASIENTGSGNMTISGFEEVSNLEIDNGGSGNITISGSGSALSLKNSGSGSYKGFGFIAQNCSVTNSGSGSCEINCTDALSGSNSGSGSIFYKGTPTIDVTNTGSGEVVDSN